MAILWVKNLTFHRDDQKRSDPSDFALKEPIFSSLKFKLIISFTNLVTKNCHFQIFLKLIKI